MNATLMAVLTQLGLLHYLMFITGAISVASGLNMMIPQPKPGSHWLPVRKLLNAVALALGNAKPANEPPLATWIQRVLISIAANLPPAPQQASAPLQPAAQTVTPRPIVSPRADPPIVGPNSVIRVPPAAPPGVAPAPTPVVPAAAPEATAAAPPVSPA